MMIKSMTEAATLCASMAAFMRHHPDEMAVFEKTRYLYPDVAFGRLHELMAVWIGPDFKVKVPVDSDTYPILLGAARAMFLLMT